MGDNTSPILLTNVPQPIATFNKPFELSELVGNLDGVMYLYTGEAVNVTCVSDVEEGQTKYFLAYDNGESHIGELTVDGNALLCSEKEEVNYLFDIDYKHQNRKFFELSNGTYAVALPWLGLDADSKVLVSVIKEDVGYTITIHYVDNDYRAWGQAGGAIREISWFNELLTSANIANIVSLVDEIIKLEYSTEAAGGITVTSANTQPTTVTGVLDLFTDGSAFIPLRIVSRFPNGSPVLETEYSEQDVKICTLNRPIMGREIEDFKMVVCSGEPESGYGTNWMSEDEFTVETENLYLSVKVIGSDLYITADSDTVNVYDIDYDHQFQRSLPAGVTKMNVQIPQLLANPSAGQGIAIVTDSESPDQLYVIANTDSSLPYICQGDTVQNQLGSWANSLIYANVESLLQAIITMEFTGYDEIPIHVVKSPYREASATGYVVTPLIPQTLS